MNSWIYIMKNSKFSCFFFMWLFWHIYFFFQIFFLFSQCYRWLLLWLYKEAKQYQMAPQRIIFISINYHLTFIISDFLALLPLSDQHLLSLNLSIFWWHHSLYFHLWALTWVSGPQAKILLSSLHFPTFLAHSNNLLLGFCNPSLVHFNLVSNISYTYLID